MMNPRTSLAAVLAISLAVPVYVPREAHAQPAAAKKPKSVREELAGDALAAWDRAVELFGAQKWDGAQAEFLHAYEASKNPRVLFNTAMSLKAEGRYNKAIDRLRQELSEGAGRISKEEEAKINGELSVLSEYVSTLLVEVNEPGATILVDGETVGQSPLDKPVSVTVGQRKIQVSKAGFSTATDSLLVSGKVPARIAMKIEPLTRTALVEVEVQGAPSAIVKIDGKEVGSAPYKGRVGISNEPHVFEASQTGYEAASQSVVIKEQAEAQKITLSLSKQQESGKLVVTATPQDAVIEIDGKPMGAGRWEGPISARTHQVTVRKKGYYTWSQDVEVPRGLDRSVTATLNEDRNNSFVPWLIGTIVIVGGGTVAAVLMFQPKDQTPITGTLGPNVEHKAFRF